MQKLYIVYRYNVKELIKGKDYEEFNLYVIINNEKIYKQQFDELIVFKKEVVGITENFETISNIQYNIWEFYHIFYKNRC